MTDRFMDNYSRWEPTHQMVFAILAMFLLAALLILFCWWLGGIFREILHHAAIYCRGWPPVAGASEPAKPEAPKPVTPKPVNPFGEPSPFEQIRDMMAQLNGNHGVAIGGPYALPAGLLGGLGGSLMGQPPAAAPPKPGPDVCSHPENFRQPCLKEPACVNNAECNKTVAATEPDPQPKAEDPQR